MAPGAPAPRGDAPVRWWPGAPPPRGRPGQRGQWTVAPLAARPGARSRQGRRARRGPEPGARAPVRRALGGPRGALPGEGRSGQVGPGGACALTSAAAASLASILAPISERRSSRAAAGSSVAPGRRAPALAAAPRCSVGPGKVVAPGGRGRRQGRLDGGRDLAFGLSRPGPLHRGGRRHVGRRRDRGGSGRGSRGLRRRRGLDLPGGRDGWEGPGRGLRGSGGVRGGGPEGAGTGGTGGDGGRGQGRDGHPSRGRSRRYGSRRGWRRSQLGGDRGRRRRRGGLAEGHLIRCRIGRDGGASWTSWRPADKEDKGGSRGGSVRTGTGSTTNERSAGPGSTVMGGREGRLTRPPAAAARPGKGGPGGAPGTVSSGLIGERSGASSEGGKGATSSGAGAGAGGGREGVLVGCSEFPPPGWGGPSPARGRGAVPRRRRSRCC